MVDVAGAAVVALLTRAPSSGGKSRLFAALRRPPDPALLAALLLDTLDGAMLEDAVRSVAVEPPRCCDEVHGLVPNDVDVVPQSEGTLGDRMRSLMTQLFGRGARAVALIGSDLPDIRAHVLSTAFAVLVRDPRALVLGPAADGGYYLIAATSVPQVFAGIEWGTNRVLAQTLQAAAARNLRVELLESMIDVDSPEDLQRLVDGVPGAASRTRAWALANGIASRRENVSSEGSS
jgi:rSAM/selenodomain-associated transferase 1